MLRLSQYLQSNSFQKQLFNYLKGVCVFVKTSMCARRYYFLRNKKIAIYFDNGDCSMHANYKQISKSIYNTKKVFCYIIFASNFIETLDIYMQLLIYLTFSFIAPRNTQKTNRGFVRMNYSTEPTNSTNKLKIKRRKACSTYTALISHKRIPLP